MESNSPSKDEALNDSEIKFNNLKAELEQATEEKILETIKSIKAEDINQWCKEQWGSFLEVVGAKISDVKHLLRFVEWVQPIVLKTSIGIHLLVIVFVLKLVDYFLSKGEDTSSSKAQEGSIKALILLALRIISDSKIALVKSFTVKEYGLLEKVIILSSNIGGRKPSFIDIKIILEIWKSFSTLFAFYKKRAVQDGRDTNILKRKLIKPVKYLLEEVGRNNKLMHNIQALKQPIEQVDKYLRVTNFYLKILQQITAEMKHEEFVAPNEFYENHKKSKLLPKHLIGTKVAELLDKYVQNSFDVLLSYVYKHPDLWTSLLMSINNEPEKENYVLIETYFAAIISDGDGSFIVSKTTDLIKIFDYCFNESKFRFDVHYDSIITKFSALTILDETPNLVKYLRENVLRDNFWIATTSTDVLILLQRYQHKHSEQSSIILQKEFNFWRDCYAQFSLFCSDVKQIQVVRLLKNCLQLSETIPNLQLMKNLKAPYKSAEDYRFLLATDLHKNFETEATNLNKELCKLLRQLSTGNSTTDDYYRAIVYMQFLESLNSKINEETIDFLEEMMERLLNSDTAQWKAFSLFISISLRLVTKFADTNSQYSADKCLNYLDTKHKVTNLPGSTKLLHFYSESTLQSIRQQANYALKQAHIDTSCEMSFAAITELVELISTGKYHNCLDSYSPEEPQRKRKCFDY